MEEMRWMSYTPPYAITVGVPLIPLNQNSGGTCFWPGTHLKYMRAQDAAKERGYGFEAELGTVVIFDYRVVHCGTANNSNLIRPLLYYIYSCNWFRDAKNYDRQDPLLVTPAQVQNQPSEYRHLFDWVFDMKTRKSIKAGNASSENPDAD